MLPSPSNCRSAFLPSYALLSLSNTTTSIRSISDLLSDLPVAFPSSVDESPNERERLVGDAPRTHLLPAPDASGALTKGNWQRNAKNGDRVLDRAEIDWGASGRWFKSSRPDPSFFPVRLVGTPTGTSMER